MQVKNTISGRQRVYLPPRTREISATTAKVFAGSWGNGEIGGGFVDLFGDLSEEEEL